MSVYAKIGRLTLQLESDRIILKQFDSTPHVIRGYIILDTLELQDGAQEAIEGVLEVTTSIGPYTLQITTPRPTSFFHRQTESAIPSNRDLITFAPRSYTKRGLVTPFTVVVPPALWPSVGQTAVFQLSANVSVHFKHKRTGGAEIVSRVAEAVTRMTCYPTSS